MFAKIISRRQKSPLSDIRCNPNSLPCISFRASNLDPSDGDIHSDISETAKKIADLESDFDENEELIGPSHLDRMHSLVIPYDQNNKVCMYVCVLNIPPTAEFIQRWAHGLKSHLTD